MIKVTEKFDLRDIYAFQLGFESPHFFDTDFDSWKASFESDMDGAGRTLFRALHVKAAYDGDALLGFVQYGKTAFGFDDNGEISGEIFYSVIRNLYFVKGRIDAGQKLLDEAVNSFDSHERVYAFFHYFGMSCFARHGKLFEAHGHIESLLKDNGFEIEHENVYYSSVLCGCEAAEVVLSAGELTKGDQQYIEFRIDGGQVGGCEIHYLSETAAYLRWIYVNGDLAGKGIGTKCMGALKRSLYEKGVRRFDTDTALDNHVAQHYYEKTSFVREGVTRSFYKDC